MFGPTFIDERLRPTRRMLMVFIGVESGGAFTRRAERLQIRGMSRGWSETSIESLLTRLLARAKDANQVPFQGLERRSPQRFCNPFRVDFQGESP